MTTEPEHDPAMRECDHCGAHFFPEDMNGDHCNDCAAELFGEED